MSVLEVKLHKGTARCGPAPPEILAARVVTWLIAETDQFVIADAVAHMGFPSRSNDAASSVPPTFSDAAVDSLREDMDA